MFISSIDEFPKESKTHEQDEDLHQCVFLHVPLLPLSKLKSVVLEPYT